MAYDIRMGELVKALGAPPRLVRRIVQDLRAEGLVERRKVATKSGCPDHVYVRPRGGAPSLRASGVNLPALLEGAEPRPKRKRFWAWMFERAAINKAFREQQEAHARKGAA